MNTKSNVSKQPTSEDMSSPLPKVNKTNTQVESNIQINSTMKLKVIIENKEYTVINDVRKLPRISKTLVELARSTIPDSIRFNQSLRNELKVIENVVTEPYRNDIPYEGYDVSLSDDLEHLEIQYKHPEIENICIMSLESLEKQQKFKDIDIFSDEVINPSKENLWLVQKNKQYRIEDISPFQNETTTLADEKSIRWRLGSYFAIFMTLILLSLIPWLGFFLTLCTLFIAFVYYLDFTHISLQYLIQDQIRNVNYRRLYIK